LLQLSGPREKRPVTRESLAIGSFTHLELDTDLLLIIALVLYMTLTEEDVLCWVCPVARTVQSKLEMG
jgi:hypothetical protein